jgi:hypothetical protein
MTNENRVYAPHRFQPWRGKDYDTCDLCAEPVDVHRRLYERDDLCGDPIPGFPGVTCDMPRDHKNYGDLCSGVSWVVGSQNDAEIVAAVRDHAGACTQAQASRFAPDDVAHVESVRSALFAAIDAWALRRLKDEHEGALSRKDGDEQ